MTVTSIDLEPELLDEAKLATGQSTIKGAVTQALETVVMMSRQRAAIDKIAGLECLNDLLD